jgi:hypothetical protein
MKRYLLFAGQDYYPQGGWDDFVIDSDSVQSLKVKAVEYMTEYTWWHIVDTATMLQVPK